MCTFFEHPFRCVNYNFLDDRVQSCPFCLKKCVDGFSGLCSETLRVIEGLWNFGLVSLCFGNVNRGHGAKTGTDCTAKCWHAVGDVVQARNFCLNNTCILLHTSLLAKCTMASIWLLKIQEMARAVDLQVLGGLQGLTPAQLDEVQALGHAQVCEVPRFLSTVAVYRIFCQTQNPKP